ncbi:MAG: tetratricopeptide repeat protein [Sandaracinaceae bacterium]|nr:tetratricopeptide repeat protein [Sandaracinaceae bacterium]
MTSRLPRRGPWLALLALTFVVGLATRAQAQDAQVEEARQIFDQAEADFHGARYPEAATGYRRAYELLRDAGRPTAPLILYNLGLALERAGREAEAIDAFQRFVDDAIARDEDTQSKILEARGRLVTLRARASSSPSPAERPVGSSSSSGGISPVGPILLGAGGALVVTGLVLGGVALGSDGDVGAMCPSRDACDPSLRSQHEDAQTLALVGDVLWIGGAVVAATGLVLTFVLTEGGGESATAAVSCGPTGCHAGVRGTF